MPDWPDLLREALGEVARGASTALTLAASRSDAAVCPACPAIPPASCHCQSICPSHTLWWLAAVAIAGILGLVIGSGFKIREVFEKEGVIGGVTGGRTQRRALAGGSWLGHGGAFSGRTGSATSDRD
jgi:hypothetical protein